MIVKVRGIYSTAITKLLFDSGFALAEPSEALSQRFDLKWEEKADTLIYDTEDLSGIVVCGPNINHLVEILGKNFLDIVVRKSEIGDAYVGFVKRMEDVNAIIDLGDGKEGVLFGSYLKIGSKILVQVKGLSHGKPVLSTKLRLFGENLILIEGGFTKVSKHIKDIEERERLQRVGDLFGKRNYGILWKSVARGKTEEELKADMEGLMIKGREIRENFSKAGAPGMIKKGFSIFTVDFGLETKQDLDKFREKVVPTIPNHHLFKSSGYQSIVDFSEAIMPGGLQIRSEVRDYINALGPKQGSFFTIVHKKISGREVLLKGRVLEVLGDEVKIKRKIRSFGSYDGLGTPKEKGDFAITTIKRDSWFIVHEYYSKDGVLKGKYYNVNTGCEILPKFARYLDLEVDVVETPDGKKRVVDKEKLALARERGGLSEELYNRALSITKKLCR